jgi:outer membrane biosynthesis protein TonB
MKKHLFLSAIFMVTIFSGCNSVTPKPIKQKVLQKPLKTQEVIKPSKKKKVTLRTKQTTKPKKITLSVVKNFNEPDWILNPNIDGYICNIGSANLTNNLGITKKIATIQAKANISQDIQSHIKTQLSLEKSCTNQQCNKKFTSKTNITSTQMLKNVKMVHQYTDKKEAIYYIHLCTKI